MKLIAKIAFYFVFFMLCFSIFSCSGNIKKASEIEYIVNEWQFEFNKKWYPAQVPGNIHSDLYRNKLIDDPFFGNNEQKLQWIGQQEWHYKNTFQIDKNNLQKHIVLVFEGLDTRCKIFINGKIVANTDNMFRKWEFPVNEYLLSGTNTLEVIFYPVESYNKSEAAKLPYKLPDNRVFSRKAAYHSGWDWGPKFETCGIWRPVYLQYRESFYCVDLSISCNSIENSIAKMNANLSIESDKPQDVEIRLFCDDKQIDTIIKKTSLKQGLNCINFDFEINKPMLWQCNQRGDANLYKFSAIVLSDKLCDTITTITGIRTAKLVSQPVAIGQNFYFELNGEPVFAKGANWVPMESFPGTVKREKYRDLLSMAKDAGFNMFRVWGGGYYEDDYFYELCDSLGIMVWQDFMFACNMYPGDKAFNENVSKEINQNVKRLRNHPCIVLWCGNNEVSNGFHDWGWQKALEWTPQDSTLIWNDYRNLFNQIIPQILKETDPGRSYWESSPMYGWGHPESNTDGDSHYWGVWWGKEDFEMYYSKTGRFMSEYGFQSFPCEGSFPLFVDTSGLKLDDKNLLNHQKHSFGQENINEFLEKYLFTSVNPSEYIYLSQVLQAIAMQTAFDAHFSSASYCMGSLFWQYNDCWPSISWSAVDYYGNPKALYYLTKRMFQPVNLYCRQANNANDFFAFSDNHNLNNVIAEINLSDFNGNIVYSEAIDINIQRNMANKININMPELKKRLQPSTQYLNIRLKQNNLIICERAFYFTRDNNLKLRQPEIKIEKSINDNTIQLHITSNTLVKWFYVSLDGAELSDNYFDLFPNVEKVITIKTKGNQKPEDLKIGYKYLNVFK